MTSHQIITQVLYLIIQIAFFHDLTIILALRQEQDPASTDLDFARILNQLRSNLYNALKDFQVYVRSVSNVSSSNFFKYTQLILLFQYFIDVLDSFIGQSVATLNSFEYLILPKFSLEVGQKVLANQIANIIDKSKKMITRAFNIRENQDDFPALSSKSDFLLKLTGKSAQCQVIL